MSIFDGIDMTDPCLVYPRLELALNKLLAGEGTVEFEHRTQVSTIRKEFATVNIPALQRQITVLKSQCAQRQGKRRGVRVVRAGHY